MQPDLTNYRYLLYPGTVISQNDSDAHRISGARLVGLWGIPKGPRCVRMDWNGRPPPGFQRQTNDIELRPDATGEYDLVAEVKRQIGWHDPPSIKSYAGVSFDKRRIKIRRTNE